MLHEPQAPGLGLQLLLGGAGAGDDETHVAEAADRLGERVERQMEALLVDEPAHEQDQALVRRGVLRAQRGEVLVHVLEVVRVDSVRHDRDATGRHAERARHVAAHVMRTRDHVVRAPHHRALHGVDV